MRQEDFDVVVIGGGCVGSSVLHELAAMGSLRPALIDEGRKCKSATAHSGGMVRVFHESIEHVKLALESQKILGTKDACGGLYFFHKDRFPSYEENLKMMDAAGHPFEVLTSKQGRARFPEFLWKEEEWAIFEPLARNIDPLELNETNIKSSVASGARILEDHEVLRICPYLGQYRIACNHATLTAKNIVLAGGARLIPRYKDMGLQLPLASRSIKTYETVRSDYCPTLPNYFDRETLEFARLGSGASIVTSHRHFSRLPEYFQGELIREREIEDCYAPDRAGLLGRVPGHKGLFIATGWGGTALKFSPAIGKRLASIIERDLPQRGQQYA